MWKRNDGSDPVNAVQNRFTAYLAQAVSRQKGQYMKKRDRKDSVEKHIDPMEHAYLWPEEVDMLAGLSPLAQMENQRPLRAVMGPGYKGVAAVYYRTVQKIKQEMLAHKLRKLLQSVKAVNKTAVVRSLKCYVPIIEVISERG